MKEEKKPYIRIRNRIIHPDGRMEKFPSISTAKRRSRHLSKAGEKVVVDHSEDPKPLPLNFGHSPGGKRRYYVSRAEEQRIEALKRRERQERAKRSFQKALEDAHRMGEKS